MKKNIVSIFAIAALPFLMSSCATVAITGRSQLSLISSSEMAALGEQSYGQVVTESKLSTDTAKVALLNRIGKDIAKASEQFIIDNGRIEDLKNYKWQFTLIQDDKTVNAWCMPGGKVAFYTAILPLCKNDNGIAVVMGHEVAHAIANHSGERMSQSLLLQLGANTLSAAMKDKPKETQNLFLTLYGLGGTVGVMLPYSRQHEYEADRIGLIIMASAGYDPREAVPFWERMNAEGGSRPLEFLSTHPAPENRIEQIKKFLPEALKYYKQP